MSAQAIAIETSSDTTDYTLSFSLRKAFQQLFQDKGAGIDSPFLPIIAQETQQERQLS
jgi:hypothetical protein